MTLAFLTQLSAEALNRRVWPQVVQRAQALAAVDAQAYELVGQLEPEIEVLTPSGALVSASPLLLAQAAWAADAIISRELDFSHPTLDRDGQPSVSSGTQANPAALKAARALLWTIGQQLDPEPDVAASAPLPDERQDAPPTLPLTPEHSRGVLSLTHEGQQMAGGLDYEVIADESSVTVNLHHMGLQEIGRVSIELGCYGCKVWIYDQGDLTDERLVHTLNFSQPEWERQEQP